MTTKTTTPKTTTPAAPERLLPATVHDLAGALTDALERAQAAAQHLEGAENDYLAATRTPGTPLDTLDALRATRESAKGSAASLADHVAGLQTALAEQLADLLAPGSDILRAARLKDRADRAEAQERLNTMTQNLLRAAQTMSNGIMDRGWSVAQLALLEEVRPLARLCPPDLRNELVDKANPTETNGPYLPHLLATVLSLAHTLR